MNIGENIIKLRKEKKLTQEELADLVCVGPKTVSSWEKNRNLPNIETLIILTNILDTDINTILGLNPETAKDIQKTYQRKSFRKQLLIIMVFLVILFFFINNQNNGIAFIIAKYYDNNEILTIKDILDAKEFMYESNIQYLLVIILLIIISNIFYLLYKKKWKYSLIISSGLLFALCMQDIFVNIVESNFSSYMRYIEFHMDIIILFIISILGFIAGIKIIKNNKRTK